MHKVLTKCSTKLSFSFSGHLGLKLRGYLSPEFSLCQPWEWLCVSFWVITKTKITSTTFGIHFSLSRQSVLGWKEFWYVINFNISKDVFWVQVWQDKKCFSELYFFLLNSYQLKLLMIFRHSLHVKYDWVILKFILWASVLQKWTSQKFQYTRKFCTFLWILLFKSVFGIDENTLRNQESCSFKKYQPRKKLKILRVSCNFWWYICI